MVLEAREVFIVIRLRIERPDDPHSEMLHGLTWYEDGIPVGRVVIEHREMEGPRGEQWWGNWEPVEVVEDVERRGES